MFATFFWPAPSRRDSDAILWCGARSCCRFPPPPSERLLMTETIRDRLPPVRTPRKPAVALPKGSIDPHVHVFEPGYPLSPSRGYTPPYSTLADLKGLH